MPHVGVSFRADFDLARCRAAFESLCAVPGVRAGNWLSPTLTSPQVRRMAIFTVSDKAACDAIARAAAQLPAVESVELPSSE